MQGKIIVIEGTDCSGKETQTSLIVGKLKQLGHKVERLSFPMYETPTGKIVGGPYLGKPYIGEGYFPETAPNVDPKVSALYYAADRKYNISKINDLINSGVTVFLDRYVESNMAHQGGKILDKEERLKTYKWLETLEYDLLELPKPDITIFLYMPYKQAQILKGRRTEPGDQNENNLIHLRNAEHAYLELSELHHYYKIECMEKDKLRSIESINDEIFNIIKDQL